MLILRSKRKMTDLNAALIISIIVSALCVIMLIILLISALRMKPYYDSGALKYFNDKFLKSAFEYNRTSLLISISERFLSWAVMALALLAVWKFSLTAGRVNFWVAMAIFAAFNIILYLVLLPLQYYRGFILEHQFGLLNQTLSAWFTDILKDRAISLLINTGILTLIYILLIKFPGIWWVAAAAIFIVFIIFANFIFPVLIDPLFYNFTPLQDEHLKSEIEKITEKAGIRVDNVLVADASRKTSRVNAYFTGIGSTKRIVIYDNLLNKNTDDEILSVIAHEAGHWKHRHVYINTLIACAQAAAMLAVLKLFQSGFKFEVSIRLVLLLFIIYSLVSYLIMPLDNFISRRFERVADRSAMELTQNTDAQIEIFKKLAVSNLSNVSPCPMLEYTLFSHPPILKRIGAANKNE